jgi:putative two-component system response regulator
MLHERQAVLEEMVAQRTRALRDNRLLLLHKLGRAAEFRDEETGNHILRMSHGAALIARESGWSAAAADMLRNAAPMHDIGKIGIPDHILRKPGRLTPEEWAVMKTHAEIGARLLEGDDGELMAMACEVAWTHHEQWDGSGYPRGLAGRAIPESGRVCALADVFDALLSTRPYKQAWALPDAVAHIEAQAGRQFDPALVAAFRRCLPELLVIRERFPDGSGG